MMPALVKAGGQGDGGGLGDVVASGGEDGGGQEVDIPGGGGLVGREILPVGPFEDLGLGSGEHGGPAAVTDGWYTAPGEPDVAGAQEAVVEESRLDAEAVRCLGHVTRAAGLGVGLTVGRAVCEGRAGGRRWATTAGSTSLDSIGTASDLRLISP